MMEMLMQYRDEMDNSTDRLIKFLLNPGEKEPSEEIKEQLRELFTSLKGRADFDRWFEAQHPQVDLEGVNLDELYQNIERHIYGSRAMPHKENYFKRAFVNVARYAAVVLVGVFLSSVFFLYKKNVRTEDGVAEIHKVSNRHQIMEYTSPAGARLKVVLPDSTVVWLNGKSKITLSKTFGEKDRDVSLQGEAFFDVSPNRILAFTVKTKNVDIKAYGTSFNVFAYPDEKAVETVLLSGIVSVQKRTKGIFVQSEEVMLKPNQKATYSEVAETIDVKNVESEPYRSWTEGTLIFNDTPMDEVIKKLEYFFNVVIVVKDPSVLKYRFSATLENNSIEQIMKYLSYSSPIEYVFTKSKITVTQKK